MTGVFGEVADMYDEARPGYPAQLATAIRAYHGGVPDLVVELGAGTGKGTEVLARLDAPITCIEPDPRMAAVLRAKFPAVRVHVATFEQWMPPAGGVPLIACALAWQWLHEDTRSRRVHDALAPGGTLAVFGHKYGHADPAHARALDAAFRSLEPGFVERPETWFRDDIAGSGLFADVRTELLRRSLPLSTEEYLRLLQTFSPFRRKSPALQAETLALVRSVLTRLGGGTVLDLRTLLVLARRPAASAAAGYPEDTPRAGWRR